MDRFMAESISPTLSPLRAEFSRLPSPVIIFNKSHSGSRALAELLTAGGIFMGAHCNESRDSLDMLNVVQFLVGKYYPDYSPLWDANAPADEELARLLRRSFEQHLAGFDPSGAKFWGWKLCETTYILPVLDFLFPQAKFIHLIRDGRDVAFCDHHGPSDPWWSKIYFNTDKMRTFRGFRLTGPSYRRRSPMFNALHWVNSVTVGRSFGMMLRERYLEVRYEDVCRNFTPVARRVLQFAGAPEPEKAIGVMRPKIHSGSIGKFRQGSRRDQQQVMEIVKPLLLSLAYLKEDPEQPKRSVLHSRAADTLLDRLRQWWTKK
jgi:hypothetical protein